MVKASKTKPARDNWKWIEVDKDNWHLDHVPDGEKTPPRIRRSSKNSDGSFTHWVYRDGQFIDSTFDLSEAKNIAKSGQMRPERLLAIEKIRRYLKETPRDAVAFAKLHEREKQAISDTYPWALPTKSSMEKTGVRAPRATRGDMLSKQEKKAQDLPMDSVIKKLKSKNPKRAGTDAWTRWELLFQHDGKTIEEFVRHHGNPTTLRNAVRAGYVAAEGVK